MGGGAFFGTLSGSAIANTSLLGTLLIPEMRKRGYSKVMSAGPILGAGPLAMMFPPSALAVLVGTIGNIPIGPLLIAAIVPGVMLAVANTIFIVGRCWLDPTAAPKYTVESVTWGERIKALFTDVLPMLSVFVVVVGSIILGLATPSDYAALVSLGAFILVEASRDLDWELF
jgi:TRAP-type C4-dicarboxylate transport system permease large subunit